MYLGENIKFLRKIKDLSQQELAKFLDINKASVSNYERGMSYPDADVIDRIAKHFQVSPNDFFYKDLSKEDFRNVVNEPQAEYKKPSNPTDKLLLEKDARIKTLEAHIETLNKIINTLIEKS